MPKVDRECSFDNLLIFQDFTGKIHSCQDIVKQDLVTEVGQVEENKGFLNLRTVFQASTYFLVWQ